MTHGRKLKAVMTNIVDEGLPQDQESVTPPRARVLLPLVESAHAAEPDQEMTPERVAEVLERDEAASLPSV